MKQGFPILREAFSLFFYYAEKRGMLTVSFFYNKINSNNVLEGNENGKIRETEGKRTGA